MEEEKLDFKVYSGIKSETEIERKKIPSRIKKITEIKDEPLSNRKQSYKNHKPKRGTMGEVSHKPRKQQRRGSKTGKQNQRQ